jgi:curved DNA-binding protein CbpA
MTQDYYKLLELSTTASADEIKKSYRRLALKYHPDRNPGDKISEAKFRDILQAYTILSNKDDRSSYDYRRIKREGGKPASATTTAAKQQEPFTPVLLLRQCSQIRRKLATIDRFKIKQAALFQTLNSLLNIRNLNLLLQASDRKVNRQIIDELCICLKYLDYPLAQKLLPKVIKVAGSDNEKIKVIYSFDKKLKLRWFWIKKRPYVLLAILIFIALIFVELANSN